MIRRVFTGLVAGLLFGGLAVSAAGPAAAHSIVVSTDPADGAQLDTGPAQVSLTFNENLQTGFPALTVVGPDGNLWSKGQPAISGPVISVPVGELGPPGKYTVAYRVTSADGHPVSGTRSFTLTRAGTGTPGPKAADADGNPVAGHDSGGVPLWVFIVAAVVLFGGGLLFALFGGPRGRGKGTAA
ncbi:copper resistance CopC family protein [Nocardia aurantia]|uniref:CopC domain-containing protein n=1 Tax=Nocardia aurantia TaxID=2585199 RepID=A0A7K0DQ67_9NOCA|nr:copper resistance protein CopC [Nocardia aurantia]MQY26964.1 hypothetical protein [Nocardia aurantia]